MSEWLKEHAWKACVGETLPWVRIPLSPPNLALCFQVVTGALKPQRAMNPFISSLGRKSFINNRGLNGLQPPGTVLDQAPGRLYHAPVCHGTLQTGLLRSIGLLCRGHRPAALENLALRQPLAALTRTRKRTRFRQADRPARNFSRRQAGRWPRSSALRKYFVLMSKCTPAPALYSVTTSHRENHTWPTHNYSASYGTSKAWAKRTHWPRHPMPSWSNDLPPGARNRPSLPYCGGTDRPAGITATPAERY